MSKKLMLLVAGALAALALTALPGAASAEETTLKCLGTGECTYEISGGETKFSITGGDTVRCASVTGSGSVTLNAEREGKTTTSTFFFHECKEQNTIFRFACTVPGQPSGTAKIGPVVGHNVKLPVAEAPTEAGVLLTSPTTTFTCAGGFAQTTVTGDVIGEFETHCGLESKGKEQKVNFTANEDGVQLNKTYTGNTYDLIGLTNHVPTPESQTEEYKTAAQKGTGILKFNQEVELTCTA